MINKFISNYLARQGFIKADYSAQVGRWLLPEAEAAGWTMPDPATHEQQSALYTTLNYIGTVVDIVTETCIDSDFDIVDKDTEKEIDNHPLELLIEKPNEYDSRTEFLRGHFSNRKLYGNSYWYLSRLNEKSPPDELYILSPQKITPVVNGKMGLKGYMYYPGNGDQIPLETWEIMHTKSYNPYSRYVGLSQLISLAVVAYGAKAALEWNTRLFAQNNARLPGILAFAEMIQDGDWEKMKREVANSAEKRNNMMLRGVGKGGVEWMQGSATQREMEFLAGLKSNEEAIYNRLAPGLYSTLQTSALTNGQNGLFLFMKSTIQPMLRELTDKMNSSLLPAYGDNIKAEYEDVVPEDKAMEMAEIDQFSKFHTIDEVRVEKFGNVPDPDPARGGLFVSQVTATTAAPVDVPPETMPVPEEQPMDMTQTPSMSPAVPDVVKADLDRWRKKAVRLFTTPSQTERAEDFVRSNIPEAMRLEISEKIKACKSVDEVVSVFDTAKAEPVRDSVRALADAINKAVENV